RRMSAPRSLSAPPVAREFTRAFVERIPGGARMLERLRGKGRSPRQLPRVCVVGAGVGVAALGTGSLSFDASGNAVGLFPITGGFLDPDLSNAKIEHVGSGLRLSRSGVDVDLENFLIDTTLAQDTIFGQ
ncbi:hypothetical protein, partial [Enterobacter hormaechei]|uniref:hypothetical protein n=1 Tax=Enterobacter hormaechei TaxID=158836 RepID=UPI00197D3AEF